MMLKIKRTSIFFSQTNDLDKLASARRKKAMDIIGLLEPFILGRAVNTALSIGSSYCLIEEQIHRVLFPHAKCICTDLDKKALEHFEQPQLTKIVKSATDLDFPDESFDFIMAHQVLEHINAYPSILRSFRRLCKPGGIVYINVPNPFSPMIGKEPNGEWPKPIFPWLIKHNTKKIKKDFMQNTEKYHTGFSGRYLRSVMMDFSVYDLRKPRLKQEFKHRFLHLAIDMFPSSLLFIPVETNIWCLVKKL